MKYFKEESKKNYYSSLPGGVSDTQLAVGCLMRIADATETMAQNFVRLQNDVEWYKKQYKSSQDENARLKYQIRALRGRVTRLKTTLVERS